MAQGIPIEEYYNLVGNKIVYLDNRGESNDGILREIYREGGFFYAAVQNLRPFVLKPKIDQVPIANIYKMNFPSRKKPTTARVHFGGQEKVVKSDRVNMEDFPMEFRYGDVFYDKVDHLHFKVGSEVVWSCVEDEGRTADRPLVGAIQKIGRNRHKPQEFVAVVQFDERTNHLPKYVQVKPRNRNIVKLDELQGLGEWMKENARMEPELMPFSNQDESLLVSLDDNYFTGRFETNARDNRAEEEDLINFPKEALSNPFLYELEQTFKAS